VAKANNFTVQAGKRKISMAKIKQLNDASTFKNIM
jgi:hypothetical protein